MSTPAVDLTTRYLGLELRSPLVASASPLNGEVSTARMVEEGGASAIVMPSLFEEEILHEEVQLNRALEAGSEHFAEAPPSSTMRAVLTSPFSGEAEATSGERSSRPR